MALGGREGFRDLGALGEALSIAIEGVLIGLRVFG